MSVAPTSIDTHTRGVKVSARGGSDDTPNRNNASPGDMSATPTKSNDSDGLGVSFTSARQA